MLVPWRVKTTKKNITLLPSLRNRPETPKPQIFRLEKLAQPESQGDRHFRPEGYELLLLMLQKSQTTNHIIWFSYLP